MERFATVERGYLQRYQRAPQWGQQLPARPTFRPYKTQRGPSATTQLTSQVALELARRSAYITAGGNAIALVSKTNLAANMLLWYSTLGALLTSIGAWIVYLTGIVYVKLEPTVPKREMRLLHGVDVTLSPYLSLPQIIKAADFAAVAHAGQFRLTGHPYVMHVIETASIVEGLLANSARSFTLGERAEMAVIVALLHDVLDDTNVTHAEVKDMFGKEVASMVKKVSRLSSLNQLLRRKRRHRLETAVEEPEQLAAASSEEEKASLHNMLLLMVDEPLVIVVKLGDRLHNMRTAYALAPNKRRAVATETQEVWCTLAERLGMFAIKHELEDLCFAVLHPECYSKLHAERNELWKRNVVSPAVAEDADRFLTEPTAARSTGMGAEHMRGSDSVSTAVPSTSYASRESTSFETHGSRRLVRHIIPKEELRELSTHSMAPNITGRLKAAAQDSLLLLGEGRKWQDSQARQQQMLKKQMASRQDRHQPKKHWQQRAPTAQQVLSSQHHRKRGPLHLTAEQRQVRELLKTVVRFDDTTYRLGSRQLDKSPTDLAGLEDCAKRLIYEIDVESVATGLDVHVEGRLKSLHSVWKKMMRKGASLAEIYDARALRIVVDDQGGRKTQEAIEACYSLLTTVQRLWRKVSNEDDDDYIANPKPSGYQSLHTAVIGPGGSPLEVQIRTSSMHEVAEYGRAAHWTYKENTPPAPEPSKPGVMKRCQPVMRVKGRKLNLGAVLDWNPETRRCLVVIQVNSRPNPGSPISPQEVKTLLRVVEQNGWSRPGDGNFNYYLEAFAFYKDKKFHNTDVYNARGNATLVSLFTEQDLEDAQECQPAEDAQDPNGKQQQCTDAFARMDQKVRLLREVLEWGEGVQESMDAQDRPASSTGGPLETELNGNIIVLVFPEGAFKVVPKGTTAANIIQEEGMSQPGEGQPPERQVVNVNNLLVPEDTQLKNGDFVIRTRDLLQI